MPLLYNDSDSEDEYLMAAARGPQSQPPATKANLTSTLPSKSPPTTTRDTPQETTPADDDDTASSKKRPRPSDGLFVSADSPAPISSYGVHAVTSASRVDSLIATAGPSTGDISSVSQAAVESGAEMPRREEPFRIRKKVKVEAAAPVKAEERSPRTSDIPAFTSGAPARIGVAIPEWYRKLKKSVTRSKNVSSEDQKLGALKGYIEASRNFNAPDRQKILNNLIESIHDAMFLDVNAQLVRDHRMLDDNGLQAIFALPSKVADQYPFFTRLDAEELWHKWSHKDFGTDLMHGLKWHKDSSVSMLPDCIRPRDGAVFGSIGLVNGQWWPQQICLVRDGAHTSSMGGIGGRTGQGAWSVIMSGGSIDGKEFYPDHDDGDVVLYCGTDADKGGEISSHTMRMLESYNEGKQIRLIRSSKAMHSKYRPAQGCRYDGLYKIVGFEILDEIKQRHRFKMVREPGQDPIRYEGPGKRPTRQELAVFERMQREKKFTVASG